MNLFGNASSNIVLPFAICSHSSVVGIAVSGENSHETAWARYCYGAALAAQGQAAQAEKELRAALKSYAALVPPDGMHPLSAPARLALGRLLAGHSASGDEGRRLLQQAVAMCDEFLGADDPRTREAHAALAKLR